MPFHHPIRVTWGDCDPANIVYTARIPWFALDAIDAWWSHHVGMGGFYHLQIDRGVGTPFVRMELDFRAPLTPRHVLECTVAPTRLGDTSIVFRVAGHQDGTLCFEGRFVCVFVHADSFGKRPPPADIRAIVTPHLEPEPA